MQYNNYRLLLIDKRLYKIQRRTSASSAGSLWCASANKQTPPITGRDPAKFQFISGRKRFINNGCLLTLPRTNLCNTYPMCMGMAMATVMMAADGIISNHIFHYILILQMPLLQKKTNQNSLKNSMQFSPGNEDSVWKILPLLHFYICFFFSKENNCLVLVNNSQLFSK